MPAGAATGTISVQVGSQTAVSVESFTVPLSPTISSFSPLQGIAGTSVTITGTNFSTTATNNIVKFNNTTATVTAATTTSLTVAVPAGATSGTISVQVGSQTAVSADSFTVIPVPTITSFSPLQGIAGNSVTITGTNFSTTAANNVVKFNNTTATVTAASTTSLMVTVPTAATSGTISVQVGSQTAVSVQSFTIIPKPTITSFSPLQGVVGTSVTITGTNFSTTAADNVVKFNNTTATVASASTTSLTVSVPTGATSGNISVQVSSQTVVSSLSFMVLPTTTITGFEPYEGTAGSVITISGTNFESNSTQNIVTFNNVVGQVIDGNSTSIKVMVPEGATTGKIKVEANSQVITSSADFNVFTVQVSTFAGSTGGFLDGTGTAARLNGPFGIATDAAGNFYVADIANNRIRKITPAGVVTTLAGSGSAITNDGTGTSASFNGPMGIAVDGSGNVFVSEVYGNRIRKITTAGVVTTLAGSSEGFADGTGTAAQFNRPTALAIDGAGNLFVTDSENNRIRKITSAGVVTTVAGSTEGFADGNTSAARFNSPDGIALDAANNIYISDTGNSLMRKISSGGIVSTVAGTNNFADGSGLSIPRGLTVDNSGNIYLADTFNNRICKIYPSGYMITIAGNISQG
ncbi:MAG: IPT/TIG domain-containing protein, partial [Cyclobacteriaceae bacterium]|nr:IPT/TIG domain-containing protein [Cyclobacteriaceae bacterium]